MTMPLWLLAIKTKLVGWIAGIGALLAAIGLIYLKGRGDAKEREAERKAAESLDAATAARQQAETHTTVVRETHSAVAALPASTPLGMPSETPVKLSDAAPDSAAGRLNKMTRD